MKIKTHVYAAMVSAVVIGLIAATAFTGVISADQETQPTYDEQKPDISFVSFCTVGPDSDLTSSTVDPKLDTLEYNGNEKNWQVSYNLSNGVTVDYLVLKGGSLKGNGNNQAYLLKVNDPTSPVSVFGGMDEGTYEHIGSMDDLEKNTCLPGDSGVKFNDEDGELVAEE